MAQDQIVFDDGAAYERYMGVWSQMVGEQFLNWLNLPNDLKWLDVGAGNGAFTALLDQAVQPSYLVGIDPAQAQIAYAKTRPMKHPASFDLGDAMALPYPDQSFDVAVMPLVIFFVPKPDLGVAEMVRVVKPGGWVSAYAWDVLDGGLPYDLVQKGLKALDKSVPLPPSPEASRIAEMKRLWQEAGLQDIETKVIEVSRTFADFNDFWTTILGAPSAGATLATLTPVEVAQLQVELRSRLQNEPNGGVSCRGWANAIKGRVPASLKG